MNDDNLQNGEETHPSADERDEEGRGSDQNEKKNPAKRRQEQKQRVTKPGPRTLDQSQEDVANPQSPIDTPR
jgi:hypothetical protein